MNRLKTIILLFIIIFNNSPVSSQQDTAAKNILILFAYSSDGPAYSKILYGIVQQLTDAFGDSYNLHKEYLQVQQFPQGEYPKEKFDLYNLKYQYINMDLLICVGVNVIAPIKNNADDYLLNLPTISADLDFSNYGFPSDLNLNDQTAILGFQFEIEKTLSNALSLFPETSTIYFISGTTALDGFLTTVSKQALSNIDTGTKNVFITDISMNETINRVRNLPNNSIIFIPYYTTDAKSVRYHNTEAIRTMRNETTVPIFHLSDLGIGEGSVGGYIMCFDKVGSLIGKTAVNILKGADPNSITITEKDYYEYKFDWRELKRWNLENSDLIPEGSRILFKQISIWDEYKWAILAGLFFLFLQSFLIINLVRLNRNQNLMTKKIMETESRYRYFLHEDRSLRLGQIAVSLSHELNQPLTAILSTAQAGINFINSNNSNPELLRDIFQKIVDNDKRTASILSSIKGMMKLEKKEKEIVCLNSLVEEICDLYKSEALLQEINLKLNLPNEKIYVLADRVQIQQVILNFIYNAAQSMEKINLTQKVIIVKQVVKDDEVIVSVDDCGEGIDNSIMVKLFKPFVTLKKEGTGIGLAICKSIIDEHLGKIWAHNKPGGGAEFFFSLKTVKYE